MDQPRKPPMRKACQDQALHSLPSKNAKRNFPTSKLILQLIGEMLMRSVPPWSSPVSSASSWTASSCSPTRVKPSASTYAAPLTGTTPPQTRAIRAMIATCPVTWTVASLNPAMRPASAWSWPWRYQKSVTASTRRAEHAGGPFGRGGEFYYSAPEIRAPCVQMQGPYMFLGCSWPFHAAPV